MFPLPRMDWNRFFALCLKGSLSCGLLIGVAFVSPCSEALAAQITVAIKASQLMQAGNFNDAELLWRQLAQSYPKSAEIHSNLAVSLAQQDAALIATLLVLVGILLYAWWRLLGQVSRSVRDRCRPE